MTAETLLVPRPNGVYLLIVCISDVAMATGGTAVGGLSLFKANCYRLRGSGGW